MTRFPVITFDCYGTLIDWETGILSALRPMLARHGISAGDDEILETYGEIEPRLQQEGGHRLYKAILCGVISEFGARFGCEPDEAERNALSRSLANWPPFPDTVEALKRLKRRHKLAIISNIDDDLLAHSLARLEVPFDWITTAEEAGAYKPSRKNFEAAFAKMGIPRNEILHAAQSVYHDIVPAKALGIATAWVNRRKGLKGSGATKPASETPDWEVPDLKSLADLVENLV